MFHRNDVGIVLAHDEVREERRRHDEQHHAQTPAPAPWRRPSPSCRTRPLRPVTTSSRTGPRRRADACVVRASEAPGPDRARLRPMPGRQAPTTSEARAAKLPSAVHHRVQAARSRLPRQNAGLSAPAPEDGEGAAATSCRFVVLVGERMQRGDLERLVAQQRATPPSARQPRTERPVQPAVRVLARRQVVFLHVHAAAQARARPTAQSNLPRIMTPSMSACPPTWVLRSPSSENARARSLFLRGADSPSTAAFARLSHSLFAMLAPRHARIRVPARHFSLGT